MTFLPERTVGVSVVPHPFSVAREDREIPAGLTVADILANVQPDPVLRRHAHVYIDGQTDGNNAAWLALCE